VNGATVASTVLILIRQDDNAYSVTSGLDGYGIPYELVRVPKTGFSLPALNTTSRGNYGGIISLSELAYDYDGNWHSGISSDQYNAIYAYQVAFGVRFVRIDAYPQPAFGTTTAPSGVGCCSTDVEQLISITNNTGFATANIKTDATMSTRNMYHYPALMVPFQGTPLQLSSTTLRVVSRWSGLAAGRLNGQPPQTSYSMLISTG
jgi:hypothetical protein